MGVPVKIHYDYSVLRLYVEFTCAGTSKLWFAITEIGNDEIILGLTKKKVALFHKSKIEDIKYAIRNLVVGVGGTALETVSL